MNYDDVKMKKYDIFILYNINTKDKNNIKFFRKGGKMCI